MKRCCKIWHKNFEMKLNKMKVVRLPTLSDSEVFSISDLDSHVARICLLILVSLLWWIPWMCNRVWCDKQWNCEHLQVCCCSDCNVQCMGSDWKVHSNCKMAKVGAPEAANGIKSCTFLACASISLYCKIWRAGMDDIAHILVGVIKWLSHRVRHDCGAKRLQGESAKHSNKSIAIAYRCFMIQPVMFINVEKFASLWCCVGARTKCVGKLVGVVSYWRYICRGCTWLVVVNR